MGKRSRDKGKRGELEACEALAEMWPGLKRIYGQARANNSSPDIDAPGCPVWLEVKRNEGRSVYEAMAQALDACLAPPRSSGNPSRPPVIVHKRNRGEWLVTVRAVDLARLLK